MPSGRSFRLRALERDGPRAAEVSFFEVYRLSGRIKCAASRERTVSRLLSGGPATRQAQRLEDERLKETNFGARPPAHPSGLSRGLHPVSHPDGDGDLEGVRAVIRISYAQGSPPNLETV